MARPGIFSDRTVDEVMDRAWARSRLSLRTRWDRLESKSWHVLQCAVAAGLAWFIAADLLHHQEPLFAPIVAVVCLGMTYGQRLRRVAEVTVGVAVGVAIADLFVSVVGSGAWQITAVVLVSMSAALLLDAGQLLIMQSAVQSIAVTVLGATPGQAFTRWLDAVVGGSVALVAAAVVPRAPLRQPRVQAAKVARTISALLRDAAVSARHSDLERAAKVLADARGTEELIRELQTAADEGLSVIASTPWKRADASSVRTIASIVEPLDRAMRSTRVLVRRVSIATSQGADIPDDYVAVIRDLADSVDVIGRAWAENKMADFGRVRLIALAERTRLLDHSEYYRTVLLGQLRMLVVDLLELTGLEHEEAVDLVPPLDL
jgi:uncharacterized membrane protein YgaE (UPF0421/DUF939 family)